MSKDDKSSCQCVKKAFKVQSNSNWITFRILHTGPINDQPTYLVNHKKNSRKMS